MPVHARLAALTAIAVALAPACRSGVDDSARPAGRALAARVAPVPPMNQGRWNFAGALLPDGRVLVSGGDDLGGNSAEIYDPVAQTWTATPPTTGSWYYHALVPLDDGRVLAVCTQSPHDWTANTDAVEIFDPATGAWARSAWYENRAYCRASRLRDGRVLVTGGYVVNVGYRPDSLVFSPATGAFSTTGGLAVGRHGHAQLTLSDGRVLVAGGRTRTELATSSVEIFDPAAGSFTTAAPMHAARSSATVTPLLDGRVLVAGGNSAGGPDAEVFDPVAGTWTATGPMAVKRYFHSAARLLDGRVVLLGGFTFVPQYGSTAQVELFDPATLTFSPGDPLPAERRNEVLVSLDDGRLLVAGGIVTGEQNAARSALLYEVPTACAPRTCAALGAACGPASDGCGGTLDCGTCGAGQTCAGNACVCQPATCASLGAACGPVADGCGGTLDCGTCGAGQTCAGNACVCQPATCASVGAACGPVADGCGGTLDCGTCAAGQTCAGNQCQCVPRTTCEAGACGLMGNGCGQLLNCGGCAAYAGCFEHVCVPQRQAVYDAARGAPVCGDPSWSCIAPLVTGRGTVGPETGAPNTLDGCMDGTAGVYHVDESIDGLAFWSLYDRMMTPGELVRLEATVWARGTGDVLDVYTAADASAPAWTWRGSARATASGAQKLYVDFTLAEGAEEQAVRAVFRAGGTAAACPSGPYDDADDLVFRVAPRPPPPVDQGPPLVTLESPAGGARLGGSSLFLSATAYDDVGVDRVEFYLDDVRQTTSTVYPPRYYGSASLASVADGPHTLRAVAYDLAGQASTSSVAVTIDTVGPTVALTSPPSGVSISGTGTGTVTLTATAFDPDGVKSVAFYDGSSYIGADSAGPPWSLNWSTTSLLPGTHSLTARAVDGLGNQRTSAPVLVTVYGTTPVSRTAAWDASLGAPACAGDASACDSGTLLNGRANVGPEPHASNAVYGSCIDGIGGTYHASESIDRLRILTLDGSALAGGKPVRLDASVWVSAYATDRLDIWIAPLSPSPAWQLVGTIAPTANGLRTLSRTFALPTVSSSLLVVRATLRSASASVSPCVPAPFYDVDDLVFAVPKS